MDPAALLTHLKSQTKLQLVEHTIVAATLLYGAKTLYSKGVRQTFEDLLVGVLKNAPGLQKLVDSETDKVIAQLGQVVEKEKLTVGDVFTSIPEQGATKDRIAELLKLFRGAEEAYQHGRAFGGIYTDDKELGGVVMAAENLFHDSNGLFPGIFPGLRKMETEVVRMTANLLHGGDECVGSMTTGGTESILMAVKTYRELAAARGITHPEMICGVSVHPAFCKAAHYFGVKFVAVPVRESDYRLDPQVVLQHINRNTVVIVASSPTFPQGVVDPVEEISEIGLKHNIPVHVDACLGAYHLPWLKKLGLFNKKFDFELPGVTSMSCDIHKYGFGPKQTSVILYRTAELRRYQFFVTTYWSGGLYCSPTMTGSRAGGSIAGAWTTLVHLGADGYIAKVKQIHAAFDAIVKGIQQIPQLQLMGPPDACCIAFTGKGGVSVLKLVDWMEQEKAWKNLNRLQRPVCAQLQIGAKVSFDVPTFLADLKEGAEALAANPEQKIEGMAAVYGLAEKIPTTSGIGERILAGYLDLLYR